MNETAAIAAIISLTVLEREALKRGINGKLFSLVVAAISGLGGYVLGIGGFHV